MWSQSSKQAGLTFTSTFTMEKKREQMKTGEEEIKA